MPSDQLDTVGQPANGVPLVSVLLPAFNCANYLPATLESLTAQSLVNFEVVIVDDGSTDDTGKIADEIAVRDSRFRVIHQANQGIVTALNNGLSAVRGKFIARLDGDDLAHPNRLQRQMDFLETHSTCVCVGSLYRTIDENGDLTGVQKVFSNLQQTNLSKFPPHITSLPHPSIMVRTSAMKQLGGYRPHFPHAEDFDLFLRLSQIGRLEIIPEHLLDYRIHSGSVSSRYFNRQLDSAFMALLSAFIVHNRGADPFELNHAPSIDDLRHSIGNELDWLPWAMYRDLLEVEASTNRFEFSDARAKLGQLLTKLLSTTQRLWSRSQYWKLLLAAMTWWGKIYVRQLRMIRQGGT